MDKFKHGTMVWNDISCSHLYNYLHGNPEYLLYYCTWKHGLLELLLPIHNTLCAVYICTIQWMFTTTTTFPVTVSELMGQRLYIQWFSCSYYIPYSIQFTILIFHISACIYQCISNRWKKLHQLIMETVQGRSILDITRGFELQP